MTTNDSQSPVSELVETAGNLGERRTLTAAKLRSWHRRAMALDAAAKRLMDDMTSVLGFDGENTDPIDNVTHATEDLCSLLARPELWNIGKATPALFDAAMVAVSKLSSAAKSSGDLPSMYEANKAWHKLHDARSARRARQAALRARANESRND